MCERRLLGVLAFGIVGVLAELILLGHTEEFFQWVPIVLLGLGLIPVGVHAFRPGRGTRIALSGTMFLFVMAGVVGLYQHYAGNREFELEMYPSMSGAELFRESMTGATPALAPGTMVLLGLVGLVAVSACSKNPRGESE